MSLDPPTPGISSPPPFSTEHDVLPAGTRFGEFEVLRVLGIGGFGIVYLARDHSLERDVALKEYMPASLAARGSGPMITIRSSAYVETYAIGLRSFINEARLLARFDHPSLVKVYRFWEDNATAYMVMPYMQGITLRDARRAMSNPPDEGWIRSVVDPILSGLELLHREGVYHRDIAPDNILLPPEGPPVLLDFGAARRVISDRTQSLTAILKPSYAPIEQYAEMTQLRQGPWTDLYALGAVIYYLLFGVPPSPATARAVQEDPVSIADMSVPGISPRMLEAVAWALAVRPAQRPQSAAEMRGALDGSVAIPVLGRQTITLPGNLVATPAFAPLPPPAPAPAPATSQQSMPTMFDRVDEDATMVRKPPEGGAPWDPGAPSTEGPPATGVARPRVPLWGEEPAVSASGAPPAGPPGPPTPPSALAGAAGPRSAAAAASAAAPAGQGRPPVAASAPGMAGKSGSAPPSRGPLFIGIGVIALALLAAVFFFTRSGRGDEAAAGAAAPASAALSAVEAASAAAPLASAPSIVATPPTSLPTEPPRIESSGSSTVLPTAADVVASAPKVAMAASAASAPAAGASRPRSAARGRASDAAASGILATERPLDPNAAANNARQAAREPVAARPVPAAEPAGPATAREACGDVGFIAKALCMDRECEKPQFRNRGECPRVLEIKARRANN